MVVGRHVRLRKGESVVQCHVHVVHTTMLPFPHLYCRNAAVYSLCTVMLLLQVLKS